jgi:ketosteroid isomerase-like protein
MQRVLSTAAVMLTLVLGICAQTAPDGAELTRLLEEFLDGASRNDAAIHDRFWAEDLIYTGSSGRRIGKADIMRDTRSTPARKTGDPTTVYTAEDIRIQQYGNTAIVAFRLVGTIQRAGKTEVAKFFNTGTFLKRNGKWQVVGWQATKIPHTDEEAKKAVAEVEAAFHRAVLTADTKTIASLTDESFIWTDRTGEQMTRQRLLDELASGKLKYSKLETNNVTVAVYSDTAIVRGISPRQRSAIPDSAGTIDASPFEAFYTLTFVNRSGAWRAVAMHTSRP